MSMLINDNFNVGAKKYIDSRENFKTINDMVTFTPMLIPNGFITFCEEDSQNYQWLDSNDVDTTLNKWRPFVSGSNVINDNLTTSLTKTYSIDKIKQLLKSTTGFVLVDALPDLTDPLVLPTIEETKIYLVPNPNADPTKHDEKLEYICIHIEAHQDIYRVPIITSQQDYDAFKAEIEDYVTNKSGSYSDDYATYSGIVTATQMSEAQYNEMIESIDTIKDADYTAYDTRIKSIIVSPAVQESWSWELIGSIGGGSIVFDSFIPNNQVGKVKIGVDLVNQDILKVVKDMLTIDIPTTITLTGTPSPTTLNEKGTTIATVKLDAKIALGTGVIDASTAKVVFKKDGTQIAELAYVDGQVDYTYDDTTANLTDTTTYSVEVAYSMDGVGSTATDSIQYKFTLPIFYGVSATETIADPTTLTKIVTADKSQNLSFTAMNQYCVFAVPSSIPVTKILDQNSFDNTQSFKTVTQNVQIGTDTVEYSILTTDSPVFCTNFKYTFFLA